MLFCSQPGDEVLEVLIDELGSIVGKNGQRHPKPDEYVSFVKAENILCCYFGQCFCFDPLGEVVDNHNQVLVLVGAGDEWSEETRQTIMVMIRT